MWIMTLRWSAAQIGIAGGGGISGASGWITLGCLFAWGGRSFTAMPSRSLPSSDPLTLALEPVFVYAETEISEVCYMLAGERRLSVPGDAMASFLPRG
jgi:hypothetical protein